MKLDAQQIRQAVELKLSRQQAIEALRVGLTLPQAMTAARLGISMEQYRAQVERQEPVDADWRKAEQSRILGGMACAAGDSELGKRLAGLAQHGVEDAPLAWFVSDFERDSVYAKVEAKFGAAGTSELAKAEHENQQLAAQNRVPRVPIPERLRSAL